MAIKRKALALILTLVVIPFHTCVYSAEASLNGSNDEILFIDAAVQDAQVLVDGVRPGVEVVLLGSGRDGIGQMAEVLASRRGVKAIHVISHGAPGKVLLGGGLLTAETLGHYDSQLKQIGASLRKDGDILLYGCNVARGADGQVFIEKLAHATHARIAASTSPTGSAALGGDWKLEERVGALRNDAPILSATFLGYNHLLQTTLSAGDLVIVEFNGNGVDGFTFMPLVDLHAGTVINFTDYGWDGSAFLTGEDGTTIPPGGQGNMITYTTPSSVPAGTLIRQDSSNVGGSTFAANPSWPFNFNNLNYIYSISNTISGHDGLIAFQGPPSAPTIIWAYHTGQWGQGSYPNYYWSNLPAGLTNGTNAVYFPDLASGTDLTVDDGYYSGPTTVATPAVWRSRVANSANWTTLASGTAPTLLYPNTFGVITNNAPTDIALSASSINENAVANSTVGTLSSTDPDAGNTFTYTLVAGVGATDNASFNISGSSLRITNSPNYENKSSYSVRVRTIDQGSLYFEKAFTITINDLNESPTDISLSASAINENVAGNSTVGTLSSTDADAANTFTYTLIAGVGDTDNAAFNISGSSLRITSSPDFETKSSYSVRVRTTDQGSLTFEKVFTITINNLNEAPTDISLSASSIPENMDSETTVGTLSSTDPDAGDTFAYSLVDGGISCPGTDNASFAISGPLLETAAVFDYETKTSYTICVRTTDNGSLTFNKEFTITVTDMNDAVLSRIIINPADPAKLLAGLYTGGVWKSMDSGHSWTEVTTSPSAKLIKDMVMDPTDNTRFFAATYGGGIFRGTNSGDTWTPCSNTLLGSLNTVSLAIAPDGRLYAGTEAGIFTSADCDTWGAVNTDLPVSPGRLPVAIAVDPSAPATIYAAIEGAGIYKSGNSGSNWTAAATQPTNLGFKAIIIKPGDSAILFAATYGGGVFRSDDSGASWSACTNTNLTSLNVVSITSDATGKLYAGTEAGVFVSTDSCANWSAMSSGLP